MKILYAASAVTAAMFGATPVLAQAGPTQSANANASAEVVAPISVSNIDGINFGRIAANAAPGSITVSSTGGLTSSVPNLSIAGSTGNAADFTVAGGAGLAYTRNVPASVTLTGPGSATMTASLAPSGPTSSMLDSAGADAFAVGGTLSVGANQAPGNYSGTFAVTVQYN